MSIAWNKDVNVNPRWRHHDPDRFHDANSRIDKPAVGRGMSDAHVRPLGPTGN